MGLIVIVLFRFRKSTRSRTEVGSGAFQIFGGLGGESYVHCNEFITFSVFHIEHCH